MSSPFAECGRFPFLKTKIINKWKKTKASERGLAQKLPVLTSMVAPTLQVVSAREDAEHGVVEWAVVKLKLVSCSNLVVSAT